MLTKNACFANPCPGCSSCDAMRPFGVSVSLKPSDLKAQAYERICKIAERKGWDEKTTRIMVADTFSSSVDRRPKPRRAIGPDEIDALTAPQLSRVLRILEQAFPA